MTKKLLTALLILASLTGCGPVMKSADMREIEMSRVDRYTACIAARQSADAARIAALDGMTAEQTAMVLMADAMTRQAEALSGKDPCSQGMNVYEMEVAVARSRNEVIGSLGATALRVGGAVGGAIVAADAIKSVAKSAGDHINANEGSSVTVEKTTSITETHVKTGDEAGGDVTLTGPTTQGTDKSQHETIHEAAPAATPAAEEPEAETEAPAEEPAPETPEAE